jgi:hypothetical protein
MVHEVLLLGACCLIVFDVNVKQFDFIALITKPQFQKEIILVE